MGITIDEAIKTQHECVSKTIDTLWEIAQKNQQLQADYEARLKADLKAILVELQLEIENSVRQFRGDYSRGYNTALLDVDRNIQQKVDKLKGEQE